MSDHTQNQPSTASAPPPPEDPGNKAASSIKAVGEAIGAIPSGIKSVFEAISAAVLLVTTIRSNVSNVLIVFLCTVWFLCLLARWRPNVIPKGHRRWVKGVALFGAFAIPLSTLSIYGYRLLSPPRDTIVAVAEFNGPDPQKYEVTPRLINSLSLAFPIPKLNDWELPIVDKELSRKSVVAWYRNPSQATENAIQVPYKKGEKWSTVQPDFVFFSRRDDGELAASLVDPHSDHLADALEKLQGMVDFAEKYSDRFLRIDSIAKNSKQELVFLDMTRQELREAVRAATKAGDLFNGEHAELYL
jgi:hypothetical protein